MSSRSPLAVRADLAARLHAIAAEHAQSAPAFAEQLTLLARQAEGDPTAIMSPLLDSIIAQAESPRADLSPYTTIELDNARIRVGARRDAMATVNFHEMLRLSAIYWRLHNEVARRTGAGIIAPPPSYQDDYNARRRHRRGGRW